MTKIFISYRRKDCQHQADRLHSSLRQYVNNAETDIFIDVDSIPFGVDFVDFLEKKVSQCEVLLALIGDRWLEADSETGHRGIDSRSDFVRIEIGSALERGIPVVPVLLDDAHMPSETQLPDELKPLARRNGAPIKRLTFDTDVARLVSGLPISLNSGGSDPPISKAEQQETATAIDNSYVNVRPNDWSQPEAFLAILIAAMRANHEIKWQEKEYIQALVRRSKTMRDYINSPEALTAINISVEERIKNRADYVEEACQAMPRDSHKAMFAHCVDIVLASGTMDENEKIFLDGLLEKMVLSREDAKLITDVIYEKSRY